MLDLDEGGGPDDLTRSKALPFERLIELATGAKYSGAINVQLEQTPCAHSALHLWFRLARHRRTETQTGGDGDAAGDCPGCQGSCHHLLKQSPEVLWRAYAGKPRRFG